MTDKPKGARKNLPTIISPGDQLLFLMRQRKGKTFDLVTLVLILIPVPLVVWAAVDDSYATVDEDRINFLIMVVAVMPTMLYVMIKAALNPNEGILPSARKIIVVSFVGSVSVGLASVITYFWPPVHKRYMALLDAGARQTWWYSIDGRSDPGQTIVLSFFIPAGGAMLLGLALWVFFVMTVKVWMQPTRSAEENMDLVETPEQRRASTKAVRVLVTLLQLVFVQAIVFGVAESQPWRVPVVIAIGGVMVGMVFYLRKKEPVDKEARSRAGFYR